MQNDIYFMPLGGGQRIGASCYYLRLGESNIILDAGIGKEKNIYFEPDFYALFTSPYNILSLNQINQIFISHAHLDHVGYLLKLMKEATKPDVYMTKTTALLSEYQLYDRNFLNGDKRNENQRLAAQLLFDRITVVDYFQSIDFEKYKVKFFQAGHIPGAMMILFEYQKRRILYTGDYSLYDTPLTNGCIIPDGLNIDTVIMCGLHAKHPNYTKKSNTLYKRVQDILNTVKQRHISVMCYVSQLSKGIELLKTFNIYNSDNIPIYVDETVMKVIEKIENLNVPVMDINNHIMTLGLKPPHIYITADSNSEAVKSTFYERRDVDFSLHEDFEEMKKFIKKINPKQALIVHCAKEYSPYDRTIEQEVMYNSECRTQFIFAEEKEIYRL